MSHKLRLSNASKAGFSLIELAIVLGVLGLLLTGLFQLTTASKRQINSQILAQQLQGYSKAAKSYLLASKQGVNEDSFQTYAANGTPGAIIPTAFNGTYDITSSVQGYNPNTLPLTAANGGTFTVVMQRIPRDINNKPSFVIIATVVGGNPAFDQLQLGNIATFVGAEGASIYAPTTVAAPACGGTQLNILGSYGGTCFNLDTLVAAGYGLADTTPAALSFFNLFSAGVTDSNYLWRIPNGNLNAMTTDLTMGTTAAPSVTGFQDIIFQNAGDIAMAGGSLSGVSGGIRTDGGTINTANGDIVTGGGSISTANGAGVGGGIVTGGGSIATGNGDVVAGNGNGSFNTLNAVAFIYTSDRRLKTNVQTLDNALEKITRLRGVSFDWIRSGKHDVGVIAQEVEEVYPELVSDTTIDGQVRKGVELSNLVGPMIEAIKELKAQNDALRLRVEKLEAGQGSGQESGQAGDK